MLGLEPQGRIGARDDTATARGQAGGGVIVHDGGSISAADSNAGLFVEDQNQIPDGVTVPQDNRLYISPAAMSVSERGLDEIRRHEALRLREYPDEARRPTIGWGHLLAAFGTYPNGITREQADALLAGDAQDAVDAVRGAVTMHLNQEQFDALVSLAFNIGPANFRNSTLVRRLNDGDLLAASREFMNWNKDRQNGVLRPSRGLTARRQRERELFDYLPPQPEE